MTPEVFKTQIAYLSRYYTCTPNDVQYQAIWSAMKRYSDKAFKEIVEQVKISFSPTERVPFPIVHNFGDAVMEVEAKKPNVPHYVPIQTPVEDLPTPGEVSEFMKECIEIAETRSSRR